MPSLNRVHPQEPFSETEVAVDLKLDGTMLVASFNVRTEDEAHTNPKLPTGASQWGLWNFDVVELFVSANHASTTYYEFQVSPLNQFFELEIFEPRKRFNKGFASGFAHTAKIATSSWRAEMRIPLAKLDWDRNPASIRGNAFGVLGQPERREYFSLFLPPQEKPDFHLPEHFQELIRV